MNKNIILLFIAILLPKIIFAHTWHPACSFIIQSKERVNHASVGNLYLLNCQDVKSGLPNKDWIKHKCHQYKRHRYKAIIVEGDDSKNECQHLANQYIIVYNNHNEYISLRPTPAVVTHHYPIVRVFPRDFLLG